MANSAGVLTYYLPDHLGSTSVLADSAQNSVRSNQYLPFGGMFRTSGTRDTDHKFTGQRFDDTTGLYFYGARYYDPQLGRFITPDSIIQSPFDPQTLNRYTYCRNNPVMYVDPSGHSFVGNALGAAALLFDFPAAGMNIAGHAVFGKVNSLGDAMRYAYQGHVIGAAVTATVFAGAWLVGEIGVGASLASSGSLLAANAGKTLCAILKNCTPGGGDPTASHEMTYRMTYYLVDGPEAKPDKSLKLVSAGASDYKDEAADLALTVAQASKTSSRYLNLFSIAAYLSGKYPVGFVASGAAAINDGIAGTSFIAHWGMTRQSQSLRNAGTSFLSIPLDMVPGLKPLEPRTVAGGLLYMRGAASMASWYAGLEAAGATALKFIIGEAAEKASKK